MKVMLFTCDRCHFGKQEHAATEKPKDWREIHGDSGSPFYKLLCDKCWDDLGAFVVGAQIVREVEAVKR